MDRRDEPIQKVSNKGTYITIDIDKDKPEVGLWVNIPVITISSSIGAITVDISSILEPDKE